MTKKGTDIVAYITIVGWVLAFACGTRTESGFHLNQALVLFLANVVWGIVAKILAFIPILGWIALGVGYLVLFVFWVMGLVSAIQGEEKPLPLIGEIHILNFYVKNLTTKSKDPHGAAPRCVWHASGSKPLRVLLFFDYVGNIA